MGIFYPSKPKFKIMMTGIDSNVEEIPRYITNEIKESMVLIGMNVQTFDYKNLLINNWYRDRVSDKNYMMRGEGKPFFEQNNGIIFVIDAESMEALDWYYESQRKIFEDILNEEIYKSLPILLIANKQEKNQPIKANEICEKWDLKNIIKNRKWHIMEARSNSKEELMKALDWMSEQMTKIE